MINAMTIEGKLKRLEAIRDELFDMANEFALNKDGVIGGELHQSCNKIFNAIRLIRNGVKPEDSDKQIMEWCARQPFPIDPATARQLALLARDELKA